MIRIDPKIDKCSFIGWHLVKIVSVFDGDTVNVILILGITGFRFGLRINNIDTAETRSHNPILREYANKAKDFLKSILKPDDIYIARIINNDKYGGRLVGDIFYKTTNNTYNSISNLMIDTKLALPYNGKTKATEEKWLNFIDMHNKKN